MTPPRVLALGATSLVGVALARRRDVVVAHCTAPNDRESAGRDWTVRVEDAVDVARIVGAFRPDAVLYCHAVCDVGRCEDEPSWAHEVNVGGVDNVLRATEPGTRFVYVSSDHIFGTDGTYTEESAPRPISVYGKTRVLAEALVGPRDNSLIVRPGLAVGPSLNGRTGHMDWLRYRSARGLPISIVADEARSAVWANDLAERLMRLTLDSVRGVRHVPASKMVSRPELARHLMTLQNIPPAFHVTCRAERPYPHLGRVELASVHRDPLSAPLPSVVDARTPALHS